MERTRASEWQSLGPLIRERRLSLGLTLVELASAVCLSQPFLSQVENGRAKLSIDSLYRIADALGTLPQAFFTGNPQPTDGAHIVLVEGREDGLPPTNDGLVGCRVLLPQSAPFQLVELTMLPRQFEQFWEHDGFEAIYVTAGEVKLSLDGDVTRLTPGGFMAYPSTIPHRICSPQGCGRVLVMNSLQEMDAGKAIVAMSTGTSDG